MNPPYPPPTPSGKGANNSGGGASSIIAQLQKDVDPIAFLNQSFPTEESLDNLEDFVKTVSDQVSSLDQVIILFIYLLNKFSI